MACVNCGYRPNDKAFGEAMAMYEKLRVPGFGWFGTRKRRAK